MFGKVILMRPGNSKKELQPRLEFSVLDSEVIKMKGGGKYPEDLIDQAYCITIHQLSSGSYQSQIDYPKAFFKAVLRRLILSKRDRKAKRRRRNELCGRKRRGQKESDQLRKILKERFFLDSLIEDLKKAGYPREQIYREILEHYAEKVYPQLLEEYEKRLLKSPEHKKAS